MASFSNGSDSTTKRSKSTTNENNYNNKNFQKNSKSRSQPNNKTSNEKTTSTVATMDTNSKGSSESSDKSPKSEKNASSDDDRCWKFRPAPRGFTSENYVLCQNFQENGVCNFGLNCVNAHATEELEEWKERFEQRKQHHENNPFHVGMSYTEELLERLHQSTNPEKIMKEKLEGVEVTCSNDLNLTVSSKTCKREWIFVLKTTKLLKAVALLQDEHRTHFGIKHVFPMPTGKQPSSTNHTENSKNDQEWTFESSRDNLDAENDSVVSHRVKIGFSTDIYGTFRQAVCFELFGSDAILVKHFCIDVVPIEEYDKIQEIKNDILTVTRTRWNDSNSNLVPYKSPDKTYSVHQSTQAYDVEREVELLERYPCPQADTFVLSQSTISGKLTEHNYQQWMHTLLYVEEMARFDLIAKFNLTTNLKITNNFVLAPNGMATSTAKYSHSGELFGVLELSQNISEETPAGYLILNNCNSLFFAKNQGTPAELRPEVFEALIEDKSKNIIYLKLSADTVKSLNVKHEDFVKVDIQFQPNRLTYCEWHLAVDKITDYKILFPDTKLDLNIQWNPKRHWDSSLDQRLNSKQKEAVLTITSPINKPLPPILLIGPYGTGKTYTLAQIIKQLLTQSEARILICTHSNSAADLYIREYLHPWVEGGLEDAKPLRIYYHKRWVATVNTVVQKYCLIELKGNSRVFKRPTVEDVNKHKIVVVTLSTSMELASLNLKRGYFTHILLDEAAQALECEAITPLALADHNTRIVLAGDHMQMSPEIFSNFARERRLHISLLERLYEYYPANFPTKILLCENYRAHEAIIKFTSELFYDQKLIASGKQPRHEKFYPLTFFTSRGEDVQDKNSTAFYNNSEVYEIVDRVCELRRKWPPAWGKFNDQSIGIMTPYADQVFRIRSELRKKRLAGISVERVLNVQGKQFRAVFLSTVRTRKTCSNKSEDIDYGFLSNSKLLNTAITRAQSLVSVVGDPVALCSVGRCRKVWERFIEICQQNKSLFGITWQMLKSQLDGLELRKTYVLNPLAPEFVPRALQTESYLREQMMLMNQRKWVGHNHNQMSHQASSHPMNFHQSSIQHAPFHMPPQSTPHNAMMNNFPQFNNTSGMINQQLRPFGSPSYPSQMYPAVPPIQNSQQFSPYTNFNNFQAPQTNFNSNHMAAMMPPNYFNSNPMNTSNMWSSSASPSVPTQGPWQIKPPPMMVQQQSPQIRPAIGPPQIRNIPVQPMYTPPPSGPIHPAQQSFSHQHNPHMHTSVNSYAAAAKFNTPNDVQHAAFNGNHGLDFNLFSSNTSKLTLNDFLTQPELLDSLKKSEKEVQFLQNVHFPEKNALHGFPHYAHLLPPNMTFYDMANKPREIQYKWFLKLSEQYGLEEADRFVDLLKQVPATPSINAMNSNGKTLSANGYEEDLSKNFLHLMDDMKTTTASTTSDLSRNHESLLKLSFNDHRFPDEIDSFFNSSIQNNHRQCNSLLGTVSVPALREQVDLKQNSSLLGFQHPVSTSPSTGNSNNFAGGERNILNGIDIFNFPTKTMDINLDDAPNPRSLPLYMRASKNTSK